MSRFRDSITIIGRMALSRRQFIATATAAAAAWPFAAQTPGDEPALFRHGVASGDPLIDRVILWTRVTTPLARSATGPVDVRWMVADDEQLTRIVARGTAVAAPERDFTVKVDAGGLQPGRSYYYGFEAGGQRSPTGRTKTLPAAGVRRVQLASVSCSNYPAGYFNVYRCVANRDDLDAVLHLGDYIYEFADGIYGDSKSTGRAPLPAGEATTLADYRLRYEIYRSDVDLQAAHARHPFIVVWDDHELANDAWRDGAANHDAKEGDWTVRRLAAYQAYCEWMPVRETLTPGVHLYRDFRFGTLADLLMLDTRGYRDRQLFGGTNAAIAAPERTLLGAAQETWLLDKLVASRNAEVTWRVLGQQVLFAPMSPPMLPVANVDVWDGYPAARGRVLDAIERERIADVAILTGDLHSSWAQDVPRDPWRGYNSQTGAGSLAVEFVTPAISSPPFFSEPALRDQARVLRLVSPHLKFLEGESRGYVLVDLTPDRIQAEYYFVPTVAERTASERKAATFVCERGASRLLRG
jgi:alkaline phosphatase D